MADIFISYSKNHAQLTEELARDLEAEGYTTWWDINLLPDDGFFPETIRAQIAAAKAVIVIWAEHSVTSRWVWSEASEGDAHGKLLQVREETLDPRKVPMPFTSGNITLVSDRTKVYEDLARRGIEPSLFVDAELVPENNTNLLSKKARIAKAIIDSDRENFCELIEISGLDPSRHLRFWDWSNLNFEGCANMHGYDFTGAILRDCQFQGARILGARFDKADLRGSNLRAALDWSEYAAAWTKDSNAPTDDHLPTGAVFQDAPFAPEMVAVPPGRFWMGSKDGEGHDIEYPRHEVTIPRAIAVGRYPVTFEEWDFAQTDKEWAKITGMKPRRPKDYGDGRDRRPVIDVSWDDAQAYTKWLSHKTGQSYRLLSEAEWEYACRAGSEAVYYFGESEAELGKYAWYEANSKRQTYPVGKKKPNAWELYDMLGNVWEWCSDGLRTYTAEAVTDPAGPLDGAAVRVVRGGSCSVKAHHARSAYRSRRVPQHRHNNLGFRCARVWQ